MGSTGKLQTNGIKRNDIAELFETNFIQAGKTYNRFGSNYIDFVDNFTLFFNSLKEWTSGSLTQEQRNSMFNTWENRIKQLGVNTITEEEMIKRLRQSIWG